MDDYVFNLSSYNYHEQESEKLFKLAQDLGLKSQKALGILAISITHAGYTFTNEYGVHCPRVMIYSPVKGEIVEFLVKPAGGHNLSIQLPPLTKEALTRTTYGRIMVRVCPVTPRHGILENEIIPVPTLTIHELTKTVQEMHSEDVDIVIQPYLTGNNVVADRNRLTIGLGHDGVTNSKGRTISLPFGIPMQTRKVIQLAGEDPDNVELEYIITPLKAIEWVQIRRSRPNPSATSLEGKWQGLNFEGGINLREYRAIQVLGLDDLAQVEALDPSEKVIIIHEGGSLNSHAAAWAREKGVPYLVMRYSDYHRLWQKGKTLYGQGVMVDDKPYGIKKRTSKYAFPKIFLKGKQAGYLLPLYYRDAWTIGELLEGMLLLGMSYASGWPHDRLGAFLSGMAVNTVARTALALCFGESRHRTQILDKNYESEYLDRLLFDVERQAYILESTGGRSAAYQRLNKVFDAAGPEEWDKLAVEIIRNFLLNRWHQGYGGRKWGEIARLARAVLSYKTPTRTLSSFNKLVNAMHNGGWFMNKVINEDTFHAISKPTQYLATYFRTCNRIIEIIENIKILEERRKGYEILT